MSETFVGLEQEGKIERVQTGHHAVAELLAVVDRDLATGEDLRETHRDWAFAIIYNALLQACHVIVAAYGYRTRGEDQHRTAIEFARRAIPEQSRQLDRVDRIRRERHRTVYRVAGRVTIAEIDDALALAAQRVPLLKQEAMRTDSDRAKS
ncbi:MAG: hypothetical protein ACRDF5_05655 [bacterium]